MGVLCILIRKYVLCKRKFIEETLAVHKRRIKKYSKKFTKLTRKDLQVLIKIVKTLQSIWFLGVKRKIS